ncbi:MAG: DUF1828 domain-containing protein [Alphaproteobacteria bacterium]|nr:DUF1828 domain-containing protein [Alphaproteobacteria bacterium]
MNQDKLQNELCQQLCAEVRIVKRYDGRWMISTPFAYPDGDHYSIYMQEISSGVIRLSDEGSTMMRLSYDSSDVGKYSQGHRGYLKTQILRETQVREFDGNFFVDIPVSKIADGVFRLGQALNQIYDLSYLNRPGRPRLERTVAAFYEEVETVITRITEKVSKTPVQLHKQYYVPGLVAAKDYPVDYSLQQKDESVLFLFGVPNLKKADLVTIILHYFASQRFEMPTLLIFDDRKELPEANLNRLRNANAAGAQINLLSSVGEIEESIGRHVH